VNIDAEARMWEVMGKYKIRSERTGGLVLLTTLLPLSVLLAL
jgi:hypothetical protein